jgi:hypothetical protein
MTENTKDKPQQTEQDEQPIKARYGHRRQAGSGAQQSQESGRQSRQAESSDQQAGQQPNPQSAGEKGQEAGSESQQDKNPIKPTNIWTFALNTGFFAGLLWGGMRIAEYYFKFTKVHPTFLIKPWSTPAFNQTTLGYMTGWAAFILFSVIAALIYTIVLRRLRGAWMGMLYGLVWWAILYFAVGPRMGMMKRLGKIEWNSLITDGCLFLLWGAFIGYTIAFEFTDEQEREPSLSIG